MRSTPVCKYESCDHADKQRVAVVRLRRRANIRNVAVNISACQFEQDELTPMVKRALEASGLDLQYLDLELTESTLMQNPDTAVSILQRLKDMGVRVSVDDFGTGYSSLNYLKRFPIDAVKIDQSFVRDITTNPDDAAIAGAAVAMAHSLKLKVIAEDLQHQIKNGLGVDSLPLAA